MEEKIGIIGAGKLGSAIIKVLNKQNSIAWVMEPSTEPYNWLMNYLPENVPVYTTMYDIQELPDIIVICVNDSAIMSVVDDLRFALGDSLKGCTIFHTSGVMPLNALDKLMLSGCETAVVHPYQTFFNADETVFENVNWTIETNGDIETFVKFVRNLGGNPVLLTENTDKALYHCSAVAVSNFLAMVLDYASIVAERSGINSNEFFPAIVNTTVNNYFKASQKGQMSLTGPIARGDVGSIRKHLDSLKNHPDLINTYCRLGAATAEMAYRNKMLDKSTYREIIGILLNESV